MTPPARRRGRLLVAVGGVLVLAAALLAAGTAFGSGSPPKEAGVTPGPAPVPAGAPLSASIAALQAGLRRVPGNNAAWAQLGSSYVQQVRLTADPSLYPKADGAFAQSLKLAPTGNAAALSGQASLAASRHQFSQAVALCDQALAVDAYSSQAMAVKVDALTELGQYDQSRVVLQQLLDLHPGVDSFTRASYSQELRGDVAGAQAALERALQVASEPSDRAFTHFYLGELAWNNGDVATAAADYAAAIKDDPSYIPPLTGRAKVEALRGDVTGAVADYTTAIQAQPQPATLLELGELLQSQGRTAESTQQYAVLRATQQLYAANGQDVDAELALFEADHGDPAQAVTLAARAYRDRPDSITAADAYGWALHATGQDSAALPLARAAVRTGLHSSAFRYHLGVIEAALHDRAAARADLTTALTLAPGWNPLQAPAARTLLAGLG